MSLQRGKPLQASPATHRAWQERSQAKAQAKAREKARIVPADGKADDAGIPKIRGTKRKTRTRRNDGPWRAECLALRGSACRACGSGEGVEMDHIKPRSQQGPSVVENGLPLCGEFTTNRCHARKTAGTLQFQFEWFDEDQIAWLAEQRWVDWDDDGIPFGEGCRHFAPRHPRHENEKGGHHGTQ